MELVVVTRFEYPIAWRRGGVPRHYSGALELDDGAVRFTGSEPSTGLEATLTIPRRAAVGLRLARRDDEAVVGVRGLVLELSDEVPILLRPLGTGELHEQDLATALAAALQLPAPQLGG